MKKYIIMIVMVIMTVMSFAGNNPFEKDFIPQEEGEGTCVPTTMANIYNIYNNTKENKVIEYCFKYCEINHEKIFNGVSFDNIQLLMKECGFRTVKAPLNQVEMLKKLYSNGYLSLAVIKREAGDSHAVCGYNYNENTNKLVVFDFAEKTSYEVSLNKVEEIIIVKK